MKVGRVNKPIVKMIEKDGNNMKETIASNDDVGIKTNATLNLLQDDVRYNKKELYENSKQTVKIKIKAFKALPWSIKLLFGFLSLFAAILLAFMLYVLYNLDRYKKWRIILYMLGTGIVLYFLNRI